MSEWCERCEAHPVRPLRSDCALNTSVRARGGQTPARNKGKWSDRWSVPCPRCSTRPPAAVRIRNTHAHCCRVRVTAA